MAAWTALALFRNTLVSDEREEEEGEQVSGKGRRRGGGP